METLPYKNVEPIWVYVADVETRDGDLAIVAVPLIDANSIATVNQHRRFIAEQDIIGKTEKSTAKVSNNEVLTDDEFS